MRRSIPRWFKMIDHDRRPPEKCVGTEGASADDITQHRLYFRALGSDRVCPVTTRRLTSRDVADLHTETDNILLSSGSITKAFDIDY